MRPIKPADTRSARYPRLDAAWRILVGAAPLWLASAAHGDATLPVHGDTKGAGEKHVAEKPKPAPRPLKVHLDGDMAYVAPPEPPTAKRPSTAIKGDPTGTVQTLGPRPELPVTPPSLEGIEKPAPHQKGIPSKVKPEPPMLQGGVARPTLPASEDLKNKVLGMRVMVLHRHGPDEPCRQFAWPSEDEA